MADVGPLKVDDAGIADEPRVQLVVTGIDAIDAVGALPKGGPR